MCLWVGGLTVQVNRDGTYDGVYVLDNSKMSRMPGHLLKRSANTRLPGMQEASRGAIG